jgi:hypothetical protein
VSPLRRLLADSPVLLVEFDMHKRVFLTNEEPEKFHVHIMTLPCCASWSDG